LVFSDCIGDVCGPMRYYETPMQSDVPRCGPMWSDAGTDRPYGRTMHC